jgi:hypothetical protein
LAIESVYSQVLLCLLASVKPLPWVYLWLSAKVQAFGWPLDPTLRCSSLSAAAAWSLWVAEQSVPPVCSKAGGPVAETLAVMA